MNETRKLRKDEKNVNKFPKDEQNPGDDKKQPQFVNEINSTIVSENKNIKSPRSGRGPPRRKYKQTRASKEKVGEEPIEHCFILKKNGHCLMRIDKEEQHETKLQEIVEEKLKPRHFGDVDSFRKSVNLPSSNSNALDSSNENTLKPPKPIKTKQICALIATFQQFCKHSCTAEIEIENWLIFIADNGTVAAAIFTPIIKKEGSSNTNSNSEKSKSLFNDFRVSFDTSMMNNEAFGVSSEYSNLSSLSKISRDSLKLKAIQILNLFAEAYHNQTADSAQESENNLFQKKSDFEVNFPHSALFSQIVRQCFFKFPNLSTEWFKNLLQHVGVLRCWIVQPEEDKYWLGNDKDLKKTSKTLNSKLDGQDEELLMMLPNEPSPGNEIWKSVKCSCLHHCSKNTLSSDSDELLISLYEISNPQEQKENQRLFICVVSLPRFLENIAENICLVLFLSIRMLEHPDFRQIAHLFSKKPNLEREADEMQVSKNGNYFFYEENSIYRLIKYQFQQTRKLESSSGHKEGPGEDFLGAVDDFDNNFGSSERKNSTNSDGNHQDIDFYDLDVCEFLKNSALFKEIFNCKQTISVFFPQNINFGSGLFAGFGNEDKTLEDFQDNSLQTSSSSPNEAALNSRTKSLFSDFQKNLSDFLPARKPFLIAQKNNESIKNENEFEKRESKPQSSSSPNQPPLSPLVPSKKIVSFDKSPKLDSSAQSTIPISSPNNQIISPKSNSIQISKDKPSNEIFFPIAAGQSPKKNNMMSPNQRFGHRSQQHLPAVSLSNSNSLEISVETNPTHKDLPHVNNNNMTSPSSSLKKEPNTARGKLEDNDEEGFFKNIAPNPPKPKQTDNSKLEANFAHFFSHSSKMTTPKKSLAPISTSQATPGSIVVENVSNGSKNNENNNSLVNLALKFKSDPQNSNFTHGSPPDATNSTQSSDIIDWREKKLKQEAIRLSIIESPTPQPLPSSSLTSTSSVIPAPPTFDMIQPETSTPPSRNFRKYAKKSQL